MNHKSVSIVKYYITYLLLMEFCLIIANNVVFVHVHILPDGTRVCHAHPYQKDNTLPSKQHQHTDFELMLLGQENHYLPLKSGNNTAVIDNNYLSGNEQPMLKYIYEVYYRSGQRGPPLFPV